MISVRVAPLFSKLLSLVDRLGRRTTMSLVYTYRVLEMIYLSVRAGIIDESQSLRAIFDVVSAQIYFTGCQALPLMTVLALATGTIAILQSATQLSMIGSASMLGNILVIIIVREVGPLVTALIVIARSGTAVASEIGNMRVNREIEALEVMGINPLSYIVFPRLFGGIISVVCLAFYFDLIAILGGFLVTRFLHSISFDFFAESIANALSYDDVWLFLLKNTFSGVIIFVISCDQGMRVRHSSHEVPQATTRAVVNAIIFVTIFNLGVTSLYYFNRLHEMGLIG